MNENTAVKYEKRPSNTVDSIRCKMHLISYSMRKGEWRSGKPEPGD